MKRLVLIYAAIVVAFGFALFLKHELSTTRAAKSVAVFATPVPGDEDAIKFVEALRDAPNEARKDSATLESYMRAKVGDRANSAGKANIDTSFDKARAEKAENTHRACVYLRAKVGAAEYDEAMRQLKVSRAMAKANVGTARDNFDKLGITWADICNDSDEELVMKMADGMKAADDRSRASR